MAGRPWFGLVRSFASLRRLSQPMARKRCRPAVEHLEARTLLSAGDLDPTFGVGGKVLTDFMGSYNDQRPVVVQQNDGKIVLACESGSGFQNSLALVRYNSDGSLDGSFENGGLKRTTIQATSGLLAAIAVQPDGKILVGESEFSGGLDHFDFVIYRFDVSGTLDPTFGTNGRATVDFGSTDDRLLGFFLLPDGKILACGTALGISGTSPVTRSDAVARFDANGLLDLSFGIGGKRVVNSQTFALAFPVVTLQPDGKILIAETAPSYSAPTTNSRFGVRRLNVDGSPDLSFGMQGVASLAIGTDSHDEVFSLAVQPSGRIIVGGSSFPKQQFPDPKFALGAFTANGAIDTSFGNGGKILVDPSLNPAGHVTALTSDGEKVLAAGEVGGRYLVVRYDANGVLDPTFASGGKLEITLPTRTYSRLTGIIPSGTQWLVFGDFVMDHSQDLILARFNAAGALDLGFGISGRVTTGFSGAVDAEIVAAARQTDGMIVVLGNIADGYGAYALARYDVSGQLDLTFGVGGRLVAQFPGSSGFFPSSQASALALQADGKILVAGTSDSFTGVVARYLPDGQPDTTFGNNGTVEPDTVDSGSQLSALLVQADGKILVGGNRHTTAGQMGFVARLTSTGQVDLSLIDVQPTNAGTYLALQADGRILVSGGLNGLARLLPDGRKDPSFASQSGPLGNLALQADGAIVALAEGSVSLANGMSFQLALTRFSPDSGSADVTFGSNGRIGAPPNYPSSGFFGDAGLLVQPNRWIVAASGPRYAGPYDFLLATFNPDGSLDAGFGQSGLVNTDFAGDADQANTIVYLPPDKLLAAGSARVNNVKQFALARYLADTSTPVVHLPEHPAFVTALYKQLLGRDPDRGGLTSFVQALDVTRLQAMAGVSLNFVTSSEYRGDFIAQSYLNLLHRPAGSAEVALWLPLLQRGGLPEQVLASLAASDEYYRNAGGTLTAWLDQLYRDLLRRARDPNETGLLIALQSGAKREQVASAILNSPEYRTGLIRDTFASYLKRGAGTADINRWLPRLEPSPSAHPSPRERFVAAVLASGEFLSKNGGANAPWLDSLYRQLLGRAPDTPGLQANLAALLNGYAAQRNAIALAITTSAEYQRRLVADYYTQLLKRQGSAAEIDHWVASLQQLSLHIEPVLAVILASTEYFQRAGSTAAGWRDQLLPDLVSRDPNRFRPLFQSQIESSTDRFQVTYNIVRSTSYLQYRVESYYLSYLGRAAAGESNSWVNQLFRDVQDSVVIAGIVSSPEFFLRSQR